MRGRYVGLMSGTSVDGVDAVLVDFDDGDSPTLVDAAAMPFDDALRDALLALQQSGPDELHRAAIAAQRLVDVHAALVAALLAATGTAASDVVAIGSHGQTVRHRPELGFTIQIDAPARLAETTGIATVADFRSRDVAAGGQGAPLVPAFHDAVFRRPGIHRAIVNLGGMANVTDLPADPATPVRGWDCGPGNALLDGWSGRHRGERYDAGGGWARGGTVDHALLDRLAAEPWFERPPPKSTGRDLFDLAWLDARLDDGIDRAPVDVQATLAELTARTVADSIGRFAGRPDELVVCGGGAYNDDLCARLSRAAGIPVTTSDRLGIAPEHVEAMAFAWLAMRCIAGRPGNLPAVTGAAGPRILGAIHAR